MRKDKGLIQQPDMMTMVLGRMNDMDYYIKNAENTLAIPLSDIEANRQKALFSVLLVNSKSGFGNTQTMVLNLRCRVNNDL